MNINERLGKAIVKIRKERGLTQEDLYVKIGRENMSWRYLSDIENGLRKASLTKLEKVAIGLEMKFSELVRYAEDIED